jgi:hypothetical protein
MFLYLLSLSSVARPLTSNVTFRIVTTLQLVSGDALVPGWAARVGMRARAAAARDMLDLDTNGLESSEEYTLLARWKLKRKSPFDRLGESKMQNPAKCTGPRLILFVAALGLGFPVAQPGQAQTPRTPTQVIKTLDAPESAAVTAPRHLEPIGDLASQYGSTRNNPIWSGYVVTGSSLKSVQGSWVVPKVNCTETPQAQSAFWVGIDGTSDPTLEQTGTASNCDGTGYYAWYEFWPSQPQRAYRCFTVKPGDEMSATVNYDVSTSEFTTTITDLSAPKQPPCTATSPRVSSPPLSSAEWIAEDPQGWPLADFSAVEFTGAFANGIPIRGFGNNVIQFTIVSGTGAVEALPSSLSLVGGSSFSVTTYIEFDAPGAGTGPLLGTFPIVLSKAGLVGIYTDPSGVAHGFVRGGDGVMVPFTASGAGSGPTQGTFPLSTNRAGAIAGFYADPNNGYHGFLRQHGTLIPIDAPGALPNSHLGTVATGINDSGIVTGIYRDTDYVYHGFILNGGNLTAFDVCSPDMCCLGTQPLSINSNGDITGVYLDDVGVGHGFVRKQNGSITSFDAPGASTDPGEGTVGVSINASGTIAGSYTDGGGLIHGFVRDAVTGDITTFPVPGSGASLPLFGKGPLHVLGAGAFSINDNGDLTGGFADNNLVLHGFMRSFNGGIAAPINAWLAGTGALQGTVGISINDQGYIVGTYLDVNSVAHGFLHFLPSGRGNLNPQ